MFSLVPILVYKSSNKKQLSKVNIAGIDSNKQKWRAFNPEWLAGQEKGRTIGIIV